MEINRIRFKPKKLDFYHYQLLVDILVKNGISEKIANQHLSKKDIQEKIIGISLILLEHLFKLQWKIEVIKKEIFVTSPKDFSNLKKRAEYKRELQEMFKVGKIEELTDKSVYDFINKLEFPSIHKKKKVSIFSIISDGQDLIENLKKIQKIKTEDQQISALKEIINPQLEFTKTKTNCEITGFSSNDIWRYFRYGWNLPQKSIPARTLQFTIRNHALSNKPVMGIGSLTNAVLQMGHRDKLVGLNTKSNLMKMAHSKDYFESFRKNAEKVLSEEFENTRHDDFEIDKYKTNEDKILFMKHQINALGKKRTDELEGNLNKNENVTGRKIPKLKDGTFDWKKRSEQPLFKMKRAMKILEILNARTNLKSAKYEEVTADLFTDSDELKNGSDFYTAVSSVNNFIKGKILTENIFDLNVCGGIQPYNYLLAGKLVALSILSNEVRQELSQKYLNTESEIASAMAGKPFIRKMNPIGFTTTSLYETGSSQYNRLYFKGKDYKIKWQEIGMTEGSSNVYIPKNLSILLGSYLKEFKGYSRSNAIFGEGSGAAMRKIGEALRHMGMNDDIFFNHKSRRIVYAALMYDNIDLSISSKLPKIHNPSFQEIVDFWFQRYLLMRINNNEVLKNISLFKAKSILEFFDVPRPKGTSKLL